MLMNYVKFQKIVSKVIIKLSGKFGFYVDVHYPKNIDKVKTDYAKIEYNSEPDIAGETMIVQNLFCTEDLGNIMYIEMDNDEAVKLLIDGFTFPKILPHSLITIKSGTSVYQFICDKFSPKMFGDGDNQATLYGYITLKPYSAKAFSSETIEEAEEFKLEELEERYENVPEAEATETMATNEEMKVIDDNPENPEFYEY